MRNLNPKRRACLVPLILTMVLVHPAVRAQQDVTPPVLAGLSYTPTSVNVVNDFATVQVTVHVTDDISGFNYGTMYMVSPSGKQISGYIHGLDSASSGTPQDCTIQISLFVPRYSEPGIWTIQTITLFDRAKNVANYGTGQLQTMGFPTQLTVVSVTDVSPPVLLSFSFSPTSVNATHTNPGLHFSAHVTDDVTGLSAGSVVLSSPSGTRSATGWFSSGYLVSGTLNDGVYQDTLGIPRYTEPGTWTIQSITLVDDINNSISYSTAQLQAMGIVTQLKVVSVLDNTPPVLKGFSISPTTVDVSNDPATVFISMHITDDTAGLWSGYVLFSLPSDSPAFTSTSVPTGAPISGRANDGDYQQGLIIPTHSKASIWTVQWISLQDSAANLRTYSTEQLQALGFPTQFVVGSSPGNVGGSVAVNGSGLAGVVVELLTGDGDPVPGYQPVATDLKGHFQFTGVAAPGNYQVMIVEPLGYSADANPKTISLAGGGTATANFALSKSVTRDMARSSVYWTLQFDVYVSGRGKADETRDQLQKDIADVQKHYTPYFSVFSGKTTFADWQAVLSPKITAALVDQAKAQLAAMVLNFTSLKIGQYTIVTKDNRTAGDVLTDVSKLITNVKATRADYGVALLLGLALNNQLPILSGIVPRGNTLYKSGEDESILWGFETPSQFELSQNYPNPFNPVTTIRYSLPVDTDGSLAVFDVKGQRIAQIVGARMSAGYHEVQFDGTNLASGVYFYRLSAGTFVKSKLLLLIK